MLGPILILICAALWATDTLFRLPLSEALDPATIVFLEHVVCVVATFPLFFMRRREVARLSTKGWCAIAFIGVMGSAAGTYFFTSAFMYLNPTVVIILQKTQPIVAILGARVFLKEKPRREFYLWALVALVAAAYITLPTGSKLTDPPKPLREYYGTLLALAAAFCWGLSTVFGKFVTKELSFGVTAFLRFAWGLLGMTFLARPSLHVPGGLFRAIVFMGLIPGVLAMYFYYAGLKRTKASTAAIAELFFPVAAVFVNWTLLHQTLTLTQAIGSVLLVAAVYCINRGVVW